MTRSPKLTLYAFLAAVFFGCALGLGRPELAGLGAPFALVLAAGLALRPPSRPDARLVLERKSALEGDEIAADLLLRSEEGAHEVLIAPRLPGGMDLVEGGPLVLRLEPGRERTVPLKFVSERWGVRRLAGFDLRTSDLAGLRVLDSRTGPGAELTLRVYPRPERLQRIVNPLDTQPFAGNRVSRAKSEGIEFADVRPYVPGDRVRQLNWRESSRHQEPYVNQQHPERNSDVIVFLDSFTAVRRGDEGTLDLAVRAASTIAGHYLESQDRVGIVGFGGIVRWLTPQGGRLQAYRIAESLLETEINFSFVWRQIDSLPARSLTPQALVIALSPLLDERGISALLDLRRRGFDLAVVDVSPLAFALPPSGSGKPVEVRAMRLWRLWREVLHHRCARLGIDVIAWTGREPLAEIVEEVRASRRHAHRTSA